ncbi:MAG: PDZ domain-containing protein [Myxococcota bacterium]
MAVCTTPSGGYVEAIMRRPRSCSPISVLALVAMIGCGGSQSGQPVGGIHARLAYSEGGGLRVLDAPAGGAAAIAGLQPDDVILTINGESVRTMPYAEIVERLRGPVGSNVQLGVFRDSEVRTVIVARQPYQQARP